MIDREEAGRILEAVDVICINCVENTLDTDVCEKCPVRKLHDELQWEE